MRLSPCQARHPADILFAVCSSVVCNAPVIGKTTEVSHSFHPRLHANAAWHTLRKLSPQNTHAGCAGAGAGHSDGRHAGLWPGHSERQAAVPGPALLHGAGHHRRRLHEHHPGLPAEARLLRPPLHHDLHPRRHGRSQDDRHASSPWIDNAVAILASWNMHMSANSSEHAMQTRLWWR